MVELTFGGALLRYLTGAFRSQDELVEHLHGRFNVQKRVARLLVSEALHRHVRPKALSEKPSLTTSERIIFKRGRDAGCL